MTILSRWVAGARDEWGQETYQGYDIYYDWDESAELSAREWDEVLRGAHLRMAELMGEGEAKDYLAGATQGRPDSCYLRTLTDHADWAYWRKDLTRINGEWVSRFPEVRAREARITAFMKRNGFTSRDQAVDALLDAVEPQTARHLELVAA